MRTFLLALMILLCYESGYGATSNEDALKVAAYLVQEPNKAAQYLDENPQWAKWRSPEGRTLLLLLCGWNSNDKAEETQVGTATLRALLNAGADIAATDADSRTALHFAAKGDFEGPLITALLDAGANVEAVDLLGAKASAIAAAVLNYRGLDILLRAEEKKTGFNGAYRTALKAGLPKPKPETDRSVTITKLILSGSSLAEALKWTEPKP